MTFLPGDTLPAFQSALGTRKGLGYTERPEAMKFVSGAQQTNRKDPWSRWHLSVEVYAPASYDLGLSVTTLRTQ